MPLSNESAQALNVDFLRFVELRFPQWLQHVRTLRDEDTGQDFLELTVPDPAGFSHEEPLEISTWGEEVTVSFAGQHRHFPWPEAYIGSDNRDRVLDYVQALMNETTIIVSVRSRGRAKLVSDARPNEAGKYPRAETSDHELCVKSWRGTYDDAFFIDWQSYLKASCS